MLDLIIKNGQCYIDHVLKNVDIAVKYGKIREISRISKEAKDIIDAQGLTVLPGCIDTQTHFRNQVLQIQKIFILVAELLLLGVLIYLKCLILIHQHQI